MIGFLAVCVGAAVGAPMRYLVDQAIQRRHNTPMPWGTLTVNLVGSFVLGVLVGVGTHVDVPPTVALAAGTGFCGTLTTYSTMSYETLRLFEDGAWPLAFLNIAMSLAGGLGAAIFGYLLGTAL